MYKCEQVHSLFLYSQNPMGWQSDTTAERSGVTPTAFFGYRVNHRITPAARRVERLAVADFYFGPSSCMFLQLPKCWCVSFKRIPQPVSHWTAIVKVQNGLTWFLGHEGIIPIFLIRLQTTQGKWNLSPSSGNIIG